MESATSMVVEAALSSLFQGLLEKLGLFFGVEEEAKKLMDVLQRIQSYLSDAEDRQIKEESVRLWLTELKDAAYDAEDIIDELEYRALRSKLEEEAPIQTKKRKLTQVRDLFSRVGSNLDLGSRIKEIRERLEAIENNSNCLHLKVMYQSERLKPGRKRPPTTSIVDESVVFGRDADREKVISLVLASDDCSSTENGTWVIPICGMGGLGKTTLAQLVYNDERVNKHFEIRAWVYVSQDFDLYKLTKEIAESVPGSSPNLANLNNIQVSIKEALKEKRFLLVLDDIWNEKPNDWDTLLAPLTNGARGSRILVTTRSQTVSSIVGTVPTHSLQGLSDEDCWSLFERRAFVEGNSDAHPDLKKIGKEIVKKCNGLPLAVKSLGGLLRSKVDVVRWETILKSEIWGLPEDKNDILPALRLSYHHLPAHLKRCFAYCCIFPKGCDWDGDQLVLLWMAQGYIQSEGSKQMEDIGREYLADLVSRSLLNYALDNREYNSYYTMHDLTHDLARSILGAEFLELEHGKSHKTMEKARHMSYRPFCWESFNFEDLYCSKCLRTLMSFGYKDVKASVFEPCVNNVPAVFFVNSRYIRFLDLTGLHITELPESIGNLIHLRHLDLSRRSIERLPNSTTRLYHLQTLLLEYCNRLVELPGDLINLVNLRRLNLRGCQTSVPPRIGRLTGLQTLGSFTVGKETGCGINELKGMIHLGGQLHISELENVVDVQEAKEAEFKKKQRIDRLELHWKSDNMKSRQEGIEKEVLEGLQPHTNLKELEIEGYCGGTFPRWLGDSSFSNLVAVKLVKCRCHLLPPFGQLPTLQKLSLRELYGLKIVGRELYGNGTVKGFPALQELSVHLMPDLEEWYGLEGDISHVSEITITECSKLGVLPLFPLTSKIVRIENCERLATLPRVSTICNLTLSGCDEQILSSLQYLTSLSYLKISQFPNLTSLPNGLLQPLTALGRLEIWKCYQFMSLSEEVGLQHLTSLRCLIIYKCPQLTFLGDEVLPTSLRSLNISSCDNLSCLPTGLKNLTSLGYLTVANCPKIHSLPEELPNTLQHLHIFSCPLKEKCRDGGEYWSKISHISEIIIDNIPIKRSS